MGSKTLDIKLFHLKRNSSAGYDEYSQCVVAAATENAARQVANEECGEEGYVWTDGTLVDAVELSPTSNEGVEGVIAWSKEA